VGVVNLQLQVHLHVPGLGQATLGRNDLGFDSVVGEVTDAGLYIGDVYDHAAAHAWLLAVAAPRRGAGGRGVGVAGTTGASPSALSRSAMAMNVGSFSSPIP